MTPFLQTKTTDNGQRGNCLATSLACLLDMPVSQIPEFEEMQKDEWRYALDKWLHSLGYKMETLFNAPEGFAIAVGWRNDNILHAVIVKDGKFYHDPNPSGEFFVRTRNFWKISII